MSNNRRKFKSNIESKQATAEVIGISLVDAYDIVGGYKAADEKTLAVAIEMLEKDNANSEFALQLIKMYKSGTSLKDAKFDKVSDEDLEKGLEKATEFARTAKDTERKTLSDATVNKFIISTQINDIYGNRVSSVAEDEGINLLNRTVEEDTTREIILGKVNSKQEQETAHKENFLKRLIRFRQDALKKDKDAKLSDAFNPDKKVSIDAQAVSDAFENSKQDAKEFDKKLEDRVEKAKSSKLKAAWHKYKTLVVAGFMAISSVAFMSSCSNKQERVPTQQEVVDTPINIKQDTIQQKNIQQADTIQADTIKSQEINADSIIYMGTVSTRNYCDNSFPAIGGYVGAYQKIKDNIDKFAGISDDPDEILNALRFADSAPSLKVRDGEAGQTARQLAQWLQPCDEGKVVDFPQNIQAMFIDQFEGNLNIQVIGHNPCDDGKVQYKTLRSKVKKEVAEKETVKEEVKDSVATAPKFTEAEAEVSEKENTVKVQQDLKITEHDGNENLTDGQQVRDNVSPEETDVKVKGTEKHKVLVKNNGTSAEADSTSNDKIKATEFSGNEKLTDGKANGNTDLANVDVDTGNSKILVEGSDTVTVKKKKAANLRKELAKKADRAAKAALNDSTAATSLFAEAEAEIFNAADTAQVKKEKANVAASLFAKAEAEIFNAADTVKVKKEQADVKSTGTEASNQAPTKGGDKEEIIFGTENAPLGTPSAFDTPERGGFEGSGVTEKEIKVAKEKLGDELYNLIVNGSPDEWFNNGNIAEGLSRREWACIFAVMSETGPHQATTQEIIDAINCERKIKTELFDAVKKDIDGVHKNRTRDGWTYDKQIYVRGVKNNGCGKKLTLDKVRTANRKKTTASGPKFPRLFKLIKPFVPAFTMAESEVMEVRENVKTIQREITAKELSGNEGLTDGKVTNPNIPVDDTLVEVEKANKRKVLVKTNNSDNIVAQEFDGNENLTDGKNLGKVEANGDIQAKNKKSKVLVKKKGQKNLTFKEFKRNKERQFKLAQKEAQKKAAEGQAALNAWNEKIKG